MPSSSASGRRSPAPALLSICIQSALLVAIALPAHAQAAQADAQAQAQSQTFVYDIPAQDLAAAVLQWGRLSGQEVVVDSADSAGVRSSAVQGAFTADEALHRLLAGTHLAARRINEHTVLLERSTPGKNAPLVTQTLSVAGSSGLAAVPSSDPTATEGSGSYTTTAMKVATKMPMSLQETPRSLNVTTHQQLSDQGLYAHDMESMLRTIPGIVLDDVPSAAITQPVGLWSRGEQIKNFQIDGMTVDLGGSVTTGTNNSVSLVHNAGLLTLPDMLTFDHVETLRGPNSLFAGNGSTAATVNLVRKRPLAEPRAMFESSYGSWGGDGRDYLRNTVDVTGPLALDGRLRGRALVSQRNGAGSFSDRHESTNRTFFGSLEFDLTPTTLVGAGASHESVRQTGLPNSYGLPRYHWGGDIGLPVGTNLSTPWSFRKSKTDAVWAYVEQSFGEDWLLRFNASDTEQESQGRSSTFSSASVQADGSGLRIGANGSSRFPNAMHPRTVDIRSYDLNLNGSFDLFGRRHQVLLGMDYRNSYNVTDLSRRYTDSYTVSIPDIRRFDDYLDLFPQDYTWIENNDGTSLGGSQKFFFEREEIGIYGTLKLQLAEPLHLLVSGRRARFEARGESLSRSGNALGWDSFTQKKSIPFTPSYALTYDFSPKWTGFLSYSESYLDQSYALEGADIEPCEEGEPECGQGLDANNYPDGTRLRISSPGQRSGPETGDNLEIGIKGAFRDGRLNVSASYYELERKNFISTFWVPGSPLPDFWSMLSGAGLFCCVRSNGNWHRSRGVDLEISGEVYPGLQLSGGYSFNRNKSYIALSDSESLNHTRTPRHQFKLWSSYQLPGQWNRLRVGLGVTAQSRTYTSGTQSEYLGYDPDYVQLDLQGVPTGALGRDVYSNMRDYVTDPRFSDQFPNGTTYTLPFDYSQEFYAVWSAMADWQINRHWSVQMNAENLFDRRYYRTIGSASGSNFYGSPRFLSLTVRAQF